MDTNSLFCFWNSGIIQPFFNFGFYFWVLFVFVLKVILHFLCFFQWRTSTDCALGMAIQSELTQVLLFLVDLIHLSCKLLFLSVKLSDVIIVVILCLQIIEKSFVKSLNVNETFIYCWLRILYSIWRVGEHLELQIVFVR